MTSVNRRLLLAVVAGTALPCALSVPVAAAPAAPAEFVWTDRAGKTSRINAANLGACQATRDATSLDNRTGQAVVIYPTSNCQGFGVPVPSGSQLMAQFQSVITPEDGVLGKRG